jgi:hypothetical protein
MNKITNKEFIELLKCSITDYEKEYNEKNYHNVSEDYYGEHFKSFDKWCADMDEYGNYSNKILEKIRNKNNN